MAAGEVEEAVVYVAAVGFEGGVTAEHPDGEDAEGVVDGDDEDADGDGGGWFHDVGWELGGVDLVEFDGEDGHEKPEGEWADVAHEYFIFFGEDVEPEEGC